MTKQLQLLIKRKPNLNIRRQNLSTRKPDLSIKKLLPQISPQDRKKHGLRVPKTAMLGSRTTEPCTSRTTILDRKRDHQKMTPIAMMHVRHKTRGTWKRHTIIGAAVGTFQKTGFVPTLAVHTHFESDIQQLLKDARGSNTAGTGSN